MPEVLTLPSGACDTHLHVYAPDRYPMPTPAVAPEGARWVDYLALRARLGLSRAVIVQPVGYGFDNRCTLDALRQGGDAARAILAFATDTAEEQLAQWDRAGVRGVRFMMIPGAQSLLGWDDLPVMAARIAPWRWTINLQLDGRELPAYETLLSALPTPLVIDHTGKFLEPVALDHPAWHSLCRLLDAGNTWVKLSAPYETSRIGAPGYDDVGRLAAELARRYPERCLWASNWPHPGQAQRPDEASLLALLGAWAGNAQVLQRILVDNPAALYRYA
ncbi:D-3-phosphoglycerate dehydrogenase [plant metagenome]|uniref:D-3-phosphoglycerate dehydrogenase n=1 Tax=plant metagenome TaxID=1297885 RepID=A0A484RPX8_9ZZZZ